MKSIVLCVGFSLLIINLIAFFVLSGFKSYPFIASEICITISLVLFIWLVTTKIDDVFKIFAYFALGIAFAVKYITAHYITESIKDSIPFLVLVGIITTEILSIVILKYIAKHS